MSAHRRASPACSSPSFSALAVALTVVGNVVTDRVALAAALIAVTVTIIGQGSRTRTGAALRHLRRSRLTDLPDATTTGFDATTRADSTKRAATTAGSNRGAATRTDSTTRAGSTRDATTATSATKGASPGVKHTETNNTDILVDRDGLVAVLTLGSTATVVTMAHTTLPDIDGWPPITDATAPAVRLQLVVQTVAARRCAMLAVRVGGDGIAWEAATLRATLVAVVGKVERKLDRAGIAHERITGAALTDLIPVEGSVRESRDQLRVGTTSQVTLHVTLPPHGMTSDALARLTDSPDAATWLTWSGRDAVIRVAADSATTLRRVVARVETTGTALRLDGQHLDGLRATLPIARVPAAARRGTQTHSGQRRHGAMAARNHPATGGAVALPPYGLQIGHDRNGSAVFLTIPADRVDPISIVVVGGDAAARVITDRASAVGIPVRNGSRSGPAATGPYAPVPMWISAVDLPTTAHAAALTAADLVICQVLSADAAGIVAESLGLSERMTAWLTRIEPGMVALIGDGAVRWAMLPDSSRSRSGLAGALRT